MRRDGAPIAGVDSKEARRPTSIVPDRGAGLDHPQLTQQFTCSFTKNHLRAVEIEEIREAQRPEDQWHRGIWEVRARKDV